MNPFANRAMILHPQDFFGRHQETERLIGRVLGASKAQSCSVVGQRRIGKSSFFQHLARVIPGREPGSTVVYLDLEAARKLSAERFLGNLRRRVLRALGETPDSGPSDDSDACDRLSELLERLEGKRRLVALLDEFDTVTANPAFDADFFGTLRYLANNFDLAFVTSSYQDLSDLCHAEEVRQSPFFNIFTTLDLGLMPPGEADELLATLAARSPVPFSARDLAAVRRLGGRYPFFLQVAGAHMLEQKLASPLELDENELAARFHAEALPHFRYFIDRLPEDECLALTALAHGATAPDLALRRLARRSLVQVEGGAPTVFSPSLAEFLRARAPHPTAQGSTGATVTGRQPAIVAAYGEVAFRYRLLRTLGSGSFGTVHEAQDSVLGRTVALKLLHPGMTRDPADEQRRRQRFEREAQALARLRHPNVVTIYDLGQWQGRPYLSMELVPGGSLADHLRTHGRLAFNLAARLVREAALGLGHAHQVGVIHRDVKPANLLLDADARVLVADFGMTRLASGDGAALAGVTGDGMTVGTLLYMAPEQLRSGKVDGRADLYSLGVVLFECLTGRRPHEGGDLALVVDQVLNDPPADPSPLVPGLPPGFTAVLARTLAKNPDERWSTGGELAEALAPYAG